MTGLYGSKNRLFCKWRRGKAKRLSYKPHRLGKRLVPNVVSCLEGEKERPYIFLLSAGR